MTLYACRCGEVLRVIRTPVSTRYHCKQHRLVLEILDKRKRR